MKTILIALLSVVLAGCISNPFKSDPEIRIVKEPYEVKVPVPVPCKATMPEKPVFAVDVVSKSADTLDKGTSVMTELEQRRQYERVLEAAMIACTVDEKPGAK